MPFDPAHRAVVGYILKQKAVSVPHPHRPLNPAKTGGKRLQRCIAQDIVRKAWRADLKTIHGSPESARRRNCRQYIELYQHQDRRFRSDRAGKVPALTVNLAGVLILAKRNLAWTHFDANTIHRLDEPTTGQRNDPLRSRIFRYANAVRPSQPEALRHEHCRIMPRLGTESIAGRLGAGSDLMKLGQARTGIGG